MKLRSVAAFFFTLLLAASAGAQEACPAGKVCVDQPDMKVFLEAAKEKQCLQSTAPTVTSDPLIITIDKDGRVYGSGSDPHPYKLHLTWCNYDLTAQGETKIVAAQTVAPDWGFRFRPKATFGVLLADLVSGKLFTETVDGGVLVEPFYWKFVNANGYVGVRSFGLGVGFDVTANSGVYVGYAMTWSTWRSNPFLSYYFAF